MIMGVRDGMGGEMRGGYWVKVDEMGRFSGWLGIREGKEGEE